MAAGSSTEEGAEFELALTKPLGIRFEERMPGMRAGVVVSAVLKGGSAADSTFVWPGDVLCE